MNPRLFLRSFSRLGDAEGHMLKIGVCSDAIGIMAPKMRHFVFMVRDLDARAANILKQEMLSVGGEAAMSYHTVCDLSKPTDCLLSGTERQFSIALPKLAAQPFGLAVLGSEIQRALSALPCRKSVEMGSLKLGCQTLVMGILNLTPDSFSGDGITDTDEAVAKALELKKEGADIIDIGGESTRPGAASVGTEEELARVIPVLKKLKGKVKVPLSIDTRNPKVAEAAIEAGAGLVNLVGGLRNPEMAELLARSNIPVILMHMQGEPGDMQAAPHYADVMDDIVSELRCQVAFATEKGISPKNIILDPGIGFGKTAEHNLEIIRRLDELRILGIPVLIGVSRKSFIGKVLGAETDDRLEGSLASAVLASAHGANIVRVHDVKETSRAIRMADIIEGK